MTQPTTSVRHLVKRAILSKLQDNPQLGGAGVQVAYGWPGEAMERECVFIGTVTGKVTCELMQTGRRSRNDVFDVLIFVNVGGEGATPDEAEDRCAELYVEVENELADDPTLGVAGIYAAGDFDVDGPTSVLAQDGAAAFYTITAHFEARYV